MEAPCCTLYFCRTPLPTSDGTSSQAHLLGMSLKSLHISCIKEVLLVQIGGPESLETFPGYALIIVKLPVDLKNTEESCIKEKKINGMLQCHHDQK